MKESMTNGCHDKEKSDNSHFGHQRKSINVVKSIDMSIFFSHNSIFKVINFTIRSKLNGKPNNSLWSSSQKEEELTLMSHLMKSSCLRLLLIDQLIGYQMRGKVRKRYRHKFNAYAKMKINPY